jgi:hypothetical protein
MCRRKQTTLLRLRSTEAAPRTKSVSAFATAAGNNALQPCDIQLRDAASARTGRAISSTERARWPTPSMPPGDLALILYDKSDPWCLPCLLQATWRRKPHKSHAFASRAPAWSHLCATMLIDSRFRRTLAFASILVLTAHATGRRSIVASQGNSGCRPMKTKTHMAKERNSRESVVGPARASSEAQTSPDRGGAAAIFCNRNDGCERLATGHRALCSVSRHVLVYATRHSRLGGRHRCGRVVEARSKQIPFERAVRCVVGVPGKSEASPHAVRRCRPCCSATLSTVTPGNSQWSDTDRTIQFKQIVTRALESLAQE